MRFQPSKNPPEEKERKCLECGNVLFGGKLKFCCDQHKKNHHEKKTRQKARELKPSATCVTCGKEFKPWHNPQSNCSKECGAIHKEKMKILRRERGKDAAKASVKKMAKIAEEKKQIPEEKPKKVVVHHPAVKRIIDMIKSKRQSCARFEETVGSVDYVGMMQIKYLEDKLKAMGVKYAV